MADYADIYGKRVKEFTDDPTLNSSYEGQVWYNENSGTLRSAVAIEAWSSGSNLITAKARYTQGGVGTQTAALAVGGYSTGIVTETEEYNGSGWSAGGALGTGRYGIYTAGTQTAGLAATGKGPPGVVTNVEEYNGSSWSEVNNNSTGRFLGSSCGTQTAGLIYGGAGPNNQTEEYDGTNWTNGGNLNTARNTGFSSGTQTAGLIAGGGPGSGNTAASEHYDGSSWTTVNSMNTARRSGAPSIAGLRTSSLAFGGFTTTMVTNTEAYDGTTWTNSPTLGTARYGLGGAGDSSGSALAFGGQNNSGTTYSLTEEFTKSINTITGAAWASGGNLNTGRYGLRGTGTQTAMVVAGGNVPPNSNTAVAEEYNGSSWTNTTSLPAVIQDGNMTGTETASIYAGGTINPGSYPGNTNAYNGSSWTSGGNMNTDVSQYGLTGTSTAAVAFGGYIGSGPGRTADVQNYNGSSWTANPTSLPAVRGLLRTAGTQTATFMAGGNAPPGPQPVTSFSYDGSSFSSEADSIVGMDDHGAWGTATEAYFMGGDQPTGTGGTGPKAVNNFYYNGTSWVTSVNMTTGKNTFGFSKSPNTAGLICGGNGPSAHMNTTEEFTGETSVATAKTLTTS